MFIYELVHDNNDYIEFNVSLENKQQFLYFFKRNALEELVKEQWCNLFLSIDDNNIKQKYIARLDLNYLSNKITLGSRTQAGLKVINSIESCIKFNDVYYFSTDDQGKIIELIKAFYDEELTIIKQNINLEIYYDKMKFNESNEFIEFYKKKCHFIFQFMFPAGKNIYCFINKSAFIQFNKIRKLF